jgi:hypothetical protein
MSARSAARQELVAQMKATIEALQAELTENRTLIQVMLDCIPGLVYRASHQADGESRLHFVSDSANEIAGMAASHLTGDIRTLFDHVHPEDRPGLIAGLVHSGEQLCTWRHTYRFVHPRKGLRWQRSWPFPIVAMTALWSGLDIFRTCRN